MFSILLMFFIIFILVLICLLPLICFVGLNLTTTLDHLHVLPFCITTLDKKFISTCPEKDEPFSVKLNPYYITGFSDGESCFTVNVYKDPRRVNGYNIVPYFQIGLHKKDIELLKRIKTYFGEIGRIHELKSVCFYQVGSLKELTAVILPHFDKYALLTNKKADYLLFKSILDLMLKKEHLTNEGLKKIIAIKMSMNKGLSDSLKTSFPGIIPEVRPLCEVPVNISIDPY